VTMNGVPPPPACVLSLPTVLLTGGPKDPILPGATVNYTISVANQNSSVCGASNFTLQPSAPAGWTVNVITGSSLTVNAGAVGNTTLQVTAPASATSGSYTVYVIGAQTDATNNRNTASVNVAVQAPVTTTCTIAQPVVSLSPNGLQTVAPGAVI